MATCIRIYVPRPPSAWYGVRYRLSNGWRKAGSHDVSQRRPAAEADVSRLAVARRAFIALEYDGVRNPAGGSQRLQLQAMQRRACSFSPSGALIAGARMTAPDNFTNLVHLLQAVLWHSPVELELARIPAGVGATTKFACAYDL
jgi:hypothetical protein